MNCSIIKSLVTILLTALAGASCKKVIDVHLNSEAQQIVIQGEVTDAIGFYTVQINKTVNVSAGNDFPPVTGAIVYITDSTTGASDRLVEVDSGVYRTSALSAGTPLHTYLLLVFADGKQYTASSTMPKQVLLDSVTFEQNIDFNGQQGINAIANFQDPIGTANYYQFTEAVNDRSIPDIFVFEDRLSSGRYIQYPLFNDSTYLQKGDYLALTMNCVDQNTYNYFFTLTNVTANNQYQTETPANPVTNLTNGALGYFSAHTTQEMDLYVY
jgi:hypothetical protein